MSHKATQWLASLEAERLSSGGFRVLFHLCDCHNPSNGCYPSQSYLRSATGLSNSGLNKVLATLEADGLISRRQRFERATQRKKTTLYMFAFEKGFQPALREATDPPVQRVDTPLSGVGSNSTKTPFPSPLLGQSHLHASGDKPVKEPVKKTRARGEGQTEYDQAAKFWADRVNADKPISSSAIAIKVAHRMLALDLCTPDQLRQIGVAF